MLDEVVNSPESNKQDKELHRGLSKEDELTMKNQQKELMKSAANLNGPDGEDLGIIDLDKQENGELDDFEELDDD